jgi:hypothetical protein
MFFGQPVQAYNKVVTVPAPVGGLNARDSLAAMPPTDAIILNNWWPQPYGCSVRKGYHEWTTGMPSEVRTLATWSSVNGTQTLYAWSGPDMYEAVNGPVGVAEVVALSTSVWETVQLVNVAGSHLICVNGVDDGILVSETGITRIVAGDGTLGTWSGINPADATQVTVHQSRLWAVQQDSSVGWYFPILSISGVAKAWDFGPLFSRGGFLQFLTTWTLDDGNGAEDHIVAMSSKGEAVVFAGGNPEDPETGFSLVGVYFIGAPVSGRRGFIKAGGDILILTQQGLVSLAAELVSTKVNEAELSVTTRKIQFLISELISELSTLFGWELRYFPKLNMIMLNVPSVTSGGDLQLAANQITGAWTQFSGMAARCWAILNSDPFFGGSNGTVYRAWNGSIDNVLLDNSGGKGIIANVQQAYNYYEQLTTQKQISMYRPTFVVEKGIAIQSTILYDFNVTTLTAPDAPARDYASLWNFGLWNQATWSGGNVVQKNWFQALGMGVAASLRMSTQTETEALWVATDYSFIGGKGLF